MSIGESEGSQDTPMRNTTPLKRSRDENGRANTTTKPKKRKMNQCQLAFHVILMHDNTVDEFDASHKSTDNDLNNMLKTLEDGKASIRDSEDVDDELFQLIQVFKEKSQATKTSRECLGRQGQELGPISGDLQTKPVRILMPDHDESHDDLIVRECSRAFNERTDSFNIALENTEKVKQQVKKVQGELGQARAEVSKKMDALRFEYEARLSQQRKDLKEDHQEAEERYKKRLTEQQQIIDDEKFRAPKGKDPGKLISDQVHTKSVFEVEAAGRLNAELSSNLAIANATTAELASKLANAEKAKKASDSQLAATKGQLESLLQKNAEWKKFGTSAGEKNRDLRTKLSRAEEFYAASVAKLNRTLCETRQELQDTRSSLVETMSRATTAEDQLGVCRSDYATLLIEVALMQKQKLATARCQKLQLDEYLTKAKFKVESLEGTLNKTDIKLTAKVSQMQRKDQLLTEARKRLEFKEKSLEHIERTLDKEREALKQKNKKILANQVNIRQIEKTNVELEAALQAKNDILASNAAISADQALEIQNLNNRASSAAEELAVERSVIVRKDEHIRRLEIAKTNTDVEIQELRSALITKEQAIKAYTTETASQKKRFQDLSDSHELLLRENALDKKIMTNFEADSFQLRLELDAKKKELQSHKQLVADRDVIIRDLKTRLSLTEAQAVNETGILKAQISTLDSQICVKEGELHSQASAMASKEERIQELEVINADFLRAQESAQRDRADLQSALEDSKNGAGKLKTELDACRRKLSAADKECEQIQQTLEGVRKDVSIEIEGATKKRISLEKHLAFADDRIDTISTDLSKTTECLDQEKAKCDALVRSMNSWRSFQGLLEEEPVLIQVSRLREEHKAFIVIEKPQHARTLWYESLDKCMIDFVDWYWHLRLGTGSEKRLEGFVDLRILYADYTDLKDWLKGPECMEASG